MESPLSVISATTSASYLVHSPSSAAATEAVLEHARQLWCLGDTAGPCANCRKLSKGTQTDLIEIAPKDKPSIGVETVRLLVKQLSLQVASRTGLRIVHISQANLLTTEAQNALLKLMEEPPAQTILILSTTQPESLLTTVRSRCQSIFIPAPGIVASQAITDAATSLLTASGFERLVQARKLIEAKVNLFEISQVLQRLLVDGAKRNLDGVALRRQLTALEQFRRHIDAGVSGRVALEQLALEL